MNRHPGAENPGVEEGYARDDALGFSNQILGQLTVMGFSAIQPAGRGCDSYIYRALNSRKQDVAVRVQALFAMNRWRNAPTWRNILRMRLLPLCLPHHPNIVRYLRCFKLAFRHPTSASRTPIPCLEMDFIPGQSLLLALDDPQFKSDGPEHIRKIVLGVLRGWTALHRRGLRQGDISPRNILLRQGTLDPVLIDMRFSIRFGQSLEREVHEFRCALQAMLCGVWRRERRLPPINMHDVHAFWPVIADQPRKALQRWAQFCDAMAPEGQLHVCTPPQLLAAAEALSFPDP